MRPTFITAFFALTLFNCEYTLALTWQSISWNDRGSGGIGGTSLEEMPQVVAVGAMKDKSSQADADISTKKEIYTRRTKTEDHTYGDKGITWIIEPRHAISNNVAF